ncbi:DUF1549 and DUF1553 domain-containing protein [Zavarzinella formosa]|uniref:DUF1549 and DUF1553 domain-containing protein n=1 Tax=Zavarzinella formosa TaxID=360055 RepID=UPI00031D3C56|nr:DUF1549 and DUF1553 domain-containing protein [Zavarzinella formosa]
MLRFALASLAFAVPVWADAPRLIVTPAAIELNDKAHPHQILVTRVDANGVSQDVSAAVTLKSANPALAAVFGRSVIGNATGETMVTVSHNGLTTDVKVKIALPAIELPPSFANDVVPILTRQGCNQGACHGKGAGQNGFRLSLRGYAPETDHRYITREFNGRRLEMADPEASLMLRKPLGTSPHEGGRVFGADSREYRVLLDWIKAGVPGPLADEAKLVKLELFPGTRTMRKGDVQQLLAIGEFGDGSRRDVTWLTKFESNDPGLLKVTPEGFVRALRFGESAIRASFQTEVAVATMAVPFDTPVDPSRYTAKNNFIDEHAFAKLAALKIEPSDACADDEFIRRVFLDATGSLPSADEVRAFMNDNSPNKRAKLVDQVLERPEYVDYWALILSDLLQNRKERDHDVRGIKGVRQMHDWVRKQVAANKGWDEIAKSVLGSAGNTTDSPAIGYYLVTIGENREAEKSEVVSSVAQAFLGTRIGCAQCHNHPLEKYTQDDYYHFAGFFSRIRLDRKDPKMGDSALKVSAPDPNQNGRPVGVNQPRTGKFMKPQPLDRQVMDIKPTSDPRAQLLTWMTDPKNEYFAGAMTNRIWKHYLGVGLVEPVDDLRATNPPTNIPLWKALVGEFVSHKYDMKHLMRNILNSRLYQLSSATRPANETDTRYFSHYYARRLPAEVMLDAISTVTGVPDRFPGYPAGVRAVQLPDPSMNSYFLALFGRSERVTACACERNGEVTMPQLLHLQNGENVVQKVKSADGRLAELLKKHADNDQVMDDLFLSALARKPSNAERDAVKKLLAEGDPRDEVFRDLFWAILNSKNFAFNH